MSIINRRGIFGLFGGGVAASITGDKLNSPVTETAVQHFGSGAVLSKAVPEEIYHARHLHNILEHMDLPSRSMEKFRNERAWLAADEASINSMKSLSPSARARILLEIHINRSAKVAMESRRNVISQYAKPLVAIGALTESEVDALIEKGEGIEKLKMLSGAML